MAAPMLELISTDEEVFEIQPKMAKKAGMLCEMLEAMGYVEGGPVPPFPLSLPTLRAEILRPIIEWLNLHENQEPTDIIWRHQHRDDKTITEADIQIFDKCYPRDKLAEVINAAYFLDMPDLITTLKEYTAHNLIDKNREDAYAWLEIPTNKDGTTPEGPFKNILG
ncbi:hypothetical protein L596_010505 [Steinernema carpocapsae]|uniref:SKP1 component POZ domain-containing protein n=1 Tax=Steinernema carpocapsae TaxID=34508 RepID=A0A4U5PJ40_STECR|nr:hypothetical protein L596_010505 [Steinernema carpocapsae]